MLVNHQELRATARKSDVNEYERTALASQGPYETDELMVDITPFTSLFGSGRLACQYVGGTYLGLEFNAVHPRHRRLLTYLQLWRKVSSGCSSGFMLICQV